MIPVEIALEAKDDGVDAVIEAQVTARRGAIGAIVAQVEAARHAIAAVAAKAAGDR